MLNKTKQTIQTHTQTVSKLFLGCTVEVEKASLLYNFKGVVDACYCIWIITGPNIIFRLIYTAWRNAHLMIRGRCIVISGLYM